MKMLHAGVFLSTFSSRFFHPCAFSNHPETLYKERSLTLNVGHWTFSTDLNSLCYLYLYLVPIQDFYSVHFGRGKSVTFNSISLKIIACYVHLWRGYACIFVFINVFYACLLVLCSFIFITQKYLYSHAVDKMCKTRNFFDGKVRYQKLCINFPFPCKVPG